jgi:SNF2 family DNA or RNA helicase
VTKDECLDLPDKLFDQRYFALTREQADLYYRAKVEILLECTDDELTSYTIFRLFTALQQIASGFWNRREEGADTAVLLEVPHERLNMLLDIIERIPADEKIIIWSKYRYSIQRITEALQQAYSVDQVALYYGDISEHGRVEQLDLFRAGARFLVASQATGGHGLTLNEARYVIFYENDFSYAHLLQAEDRCHRIGQTRPVTYIDIAARCGIDERILEALNNKGNAVKAFKQQVDKYKDLSRAEVRKRLVDEL